jgi:predicted metal-dependent phosphoesterase TrpH
MVLHSAESLIMEAARKGYDVLSITNHNQLLWSGDLEEFAIQHDLILIPGVEATLCGKHVLLYNFLDYEPSWNDPKFVRENKGDSQMVIAPHPFFPIVTALGERFFRWMDIFDAIEYSSLSLPRFDPNRKAKRVARECGLPIVGNSDLHFLYQLGRSYSLVHAEKDRSSVIQAMKSGNVRLIRRSGGIAFTAKWVLLTLATRVRWLRKKVASSSGWHDLPRS